MQEPLTFEIDSKKTRNVILDATCLIIIGEIVSLLASGTLSYWVTAFTFVEVFLLTCLSFLSLRYPYSALFSALTIFILTSILAAAVKPTYLGGSIVIKIFVLIYLVKAIPDARNLQFFLGKEKD